MPFKQAQRPCLLLTDDEVPRLRAALRRLGYQRHRGLRSQREGEMESWVAGERRGRQIHVQLARGAGEYVEVFAHTEPAGEGLAHLVSAVLDGARFREGARVLCSDLREEGWDVDRYRPKL